MSIDDMQAGREMDALIAEKVMRLTVFDVAPACQYEDGSWQVKRADSFDTEPHPIYLKECRCETIRNDSLLSQLIEGGLFGHYANCLDVVPFYSTDIAAAWQVVEKLEYNWNLYRDMGKCGHEETQGDKLYRFIYSAPGMSMAGTTAETAPLAICRAALKAYGVTDIK